MAMDIVIDYILEQSLGHVVHIRREFYRITCLLKKEQLKNSKAYQALQLMRPVFHEEKQLAYHTHKEKLV